nr:n-acetyltransferase 5 [Cryptococcus depauperatus CBS 7841]
MSFIRPFDLTDILHFNNVNADPWTATYHSGYYASYIAQWPDWCVTVRGAFDSSLKAYMISKNEPPAPDPQHHGHLTALSITPSYRGLGIARILMNILERLTKDSVDAYFVDLFVRCNNKRAIDMYEVLGYSVYRRVVDYYHGMEGIGSSRDELDGFDMRKSMPKDVKNGYVRSNGRDILVSPDQVWT